LGPAFALSIDRMGVALSWCDRLASTPVVGFQLTPYFAVHDVVRAWAPILDNLVDRFQNPTFTVDDNQKALSITTKDGFQYAADHTRMSIQFVHRMKATPVSGGPPIMEMLSKPQPYTGLLADVSARLIEAARLLPNLSNRKILQVGVVSNTRVDLKDVPPGIGRFIQYLGRPWDERIVASNIEVTSEVAKETNWIDRCQHKIVRPEDQNELMTLTFDFHRKFNSGQATTESQMKTLITKCSEDALKYFEKLAVGNIFDEHIISRVAAV
jgi:hypothetical protein